MASFVPNTEGYLTDQTILKASNEYLMKYMNYEEYQWLYNMKFVNNWSGSDIKDYWLNNNEKTPQTKLNMASPVMSGGSPTETITVDSSANFAVGNSFVFQNDGSVDFQWAYITAIPTTTTMTVGTLDGSNLNAFADNTVIILGGDFVQYGTIVDQPLRLQERNSNTIEQVQLTYTLSENKLIAKTLANESIEAYCTKEAMTAFKAKLTLATLVGQEVDPTGSSGLGKMGGVTELIPSANQTTGTFDKKTLREFITSLIKRGGFPSKQGLMVVNAEAADILYSFEDSNTTLLQNQIDRLISKVKLRGVVFTVIEEPMLNDIYPSDKAVAMFITPKAGGQAMMECVIMPTVHNSGKQRQYLQNGLATTMAIGQFVTMRLYDGFRHGIFQET